MDMWLDLTLGAVAVGLAVLLARSLRDLSAAKKGLAAMRTRYESIIDVEEERDRIAARRDELQIEVKERRGTWSAHRTGSGPILAYGEFHVGRRCQAPGTSPPRGLARQASGSLLG